MLSGRGEAVCIEVLRRGRQGLSQSSQGSKTQSDFDTGSVTPRGRSVPEGAKISSVGRIQEGGGRLRGRGQGQHGREQRPSSPSSSSRMTRDLRRPSRRQQATDFMMRRINPEGRTGVGKVATIMPDWVRMTMLCTVRRSGRSALQSNLGKFNAKKWFTYSVLCCLARRTVSASCGGWNRISATTWPHNLTHG